MQKKKITPLRRQFVLPIGDEEVLLETNFRLVEIVERVFRLNAEYIAITIFSEMQKVMIHDLAEVIALWVQGKTSYKYGDVKELVMGSGEEELAVYIGAIQGVILFCRRRIDERAFDSLSSGNGLPEPEEDEQEDENGEEEVEEPVKKPTTTRKRKTRKAG